MKEEEYRSAVDILKEYAKAYYNDDKPLVDDKTYDELYNKVKSMEDKHPEWIDPDSPTQKVGDKLETTLPINKHINRMYSLENTFSVEETLKWVKSIMDEYPDDDHHIVVDYKYDGLSMSILYESGKLIRALTRGDGETGEVVTENAINVHNVIKRVGNYGDVIEVRGEVIMTKESFEENNKKLLEKGESTLSNQRNGAAGSLRQKDPNVTKERNLHFIPWDMVYINPDRKLNYSETMESVHGWFGTKDARFVRGRPFLCRDYKELEDFLPKFYHRISSNRGNINFPLDGLVVSFGSHVLREKLGYTNKFPRFARALKFPHVEHMTTLNSVTWQVGRTGIITPVGEIEPVDIDGAKISRCTLHNLSDIYSKDIKLYDTVYIIRSGDVIPKVLGPIVEKRTGKEETILPPLNCPSCGHPVKGPLDGKVFCVNPSCRGRNIAFLTYMSSRECLDIDGLGNKVVEQLFDTGLVSSPEDIFKLTYEDLLTLDGFSDKKASSLIDSISKVKGIELWRFISSLGITYLGKTFSKSISKIFGLDFLNKSKDEYEKIPGVGVVMGLAIYTEINDPIRRDTIIRLMDVIQPVAPENIIGPLTGYRICITGVLPYPRPKIASKIEELGGIVVPSVSRITTHLLAGDNAGSKIEKANYLGIPVVSLENLGIEL